MALKGINTEYANDPLTDVIDPALEKELYARHVEIKSLEDLVGTEKQRGTAIPALFNVFYKFIQNPSTVSVETKKRMIDTDDTVGSGVDFLMTAMAARIDRYQHKSKEITQFVNEKLDLIDGGFHQAIKEIASASWAGYSVTEKVWENGPDGFVPKRLVTLPPSTVLFEVDRIGDVTSDGILQYQRNYNPLVSTAGIGFFSGAGFGFIQPTFRQDAYAKFGDLPVPMRSPNMFNYLSIRIPKLKCIHFAFSSAGRFGNPYGRDLLRRAYKWWVMKDAFLQMLSIALDRKGTPLMVIFVDPTIPLKDASKTNPSGHQNAKGTPDLRIDPMVAVQNATRNIHNDSVLILPGKKGAAFDVDTQNTDSNADVFIQSIQMCNASIMRSLLIPSLVFTNGDGTGSYALGQEHAKTWEKILDSWNEGLKGALLDQLVKELIAYNFPESAWRKDGLGSFSKRQLSQEERDKEAQVFAQAVTMGAIDMQDLNDLNKIREGLGFEPRETPIPPKNPDMTPGQEPSEFDEGPPPKKLRARKRKTAEVRA